MRVIVISNCATAAYQQCISRLFPGWDVRGAILTTADQWLQEGHEAFCAFLRGADLCVGLETIRYAPYLGPAVRHIEIPSFEFTGLHPDAYHLNVPESPLKAGTRFSRIASVGFLQGWPVERTARLFRPDIYTALGYFEAFCPARERLFASFAAAGIDLTGLFAAWVASGEFLYTWNHPYVHVFFDILTAALSAQWQAPSHEQIRSVRASELTDQLADSIYWPVYPELGRPHGLGGRYEWRTGRHSGRERYDVHGFVERNYRCLAGAQGVSECIPDYADMVRVLEAA